MYDITVYMHNRILCTCARQSYSQLFQFRKMELEELNQKVVEDVLLPTMLSVKCHT